MTPVERGGSWHISAPAKINLYLGVHAERDEAGYHRVDSVMCALDLADELTLTPADALTVETVPPADFPMEQNTVYRAAVALGEAFGREPHFAISIEKRIPLRAGLGGPSTDAAAAIRALCHLWGIDPRDERVLAVARSVGADVPFFLYDAPAYLSGRGDVMEELFCPLADVPVVLIKPLAKGSGVTAADAYRTFDEDPVVPEPVGPMVRALRERDEEAVFALVTNNLAAASIKLSPEIGDVLVWLRGQDGVRACNVCGSGSTSFAICASHEVAERIAEAARSEHDWWAYAGKMEKSGQCSKND